VRIDTQHVLTSYADSYQKIQEKKCAENSTDNDSLKRMKLKILTYYSLIV